MRISYWSSDVCSSDLPPNFAYNHPSIHYIRHKWDLMDDCLAGESSVKSRRELYLPIPRVDDDETENISRYRNYIQRAVFYNATDRKSTRLNSSHYCASRMPSSARQKKIYN